jgi:hypothetical protein
MEGDECNDWLSRGKLEKCNDNKQLLADSPGLSYILISCCFGVTHIARQIFFE